MFGLHYYYKYKHTREYLRMSIFLMVLVVLSLIVEFFYPDINKSSQNKKHTQVDSTSKYKP